MISKIVNLLAFRFLEEVTRQRKLDWMKTSVRYRTLQVLGVLMNEIQRTTIVTSLVISSILLVSFGLTMLALVPITDENLPILGISFMMTPSGVAVLLIVLGLLADVFEQSRLNSRQFQAVMAKRFGMESRKDAAWKRGFFLSCAPVKVKFASINFIESKTPVNCIDFSNMLTVNLVLLNK